MRIGVLAVQGAFAEHIAILHKLEVEALPVHLPSEFGVGRVNYLWGDTFAKDNHR